MDIQIKIRAICIVIGYACGNFLTAEVVTRHMTGRPCSELGTSGNPGMTNVLRHLGLKAGIVVLAGDILKTIIAMYTCFMLFGRMLGRIAIFYGGFGAILGHDFPIWQHFRGGKGVACCCTMLFLYSPWGFVAILIALASILATDYLCIGGAVTPAAFIVPAFLFHGLETGVLTVLLSVIFFLKHWSSIKLIPSGQCEKINVIGMLRNSFGQE